MVIVKPLKLFMFYGFFVAFYYVLISISVFTFKVCWEIPGSEVFYFAGTIELIRHASQVNGFCMVWVFTVKTIRADHRFCCFNIKNCCFIILCNIQEGFLHNGLISSLLRCRLVSISGGWKLVVSLIALHQISFSADMMPEFLLKISYLY